MDGRRLSVVCDAGPLIHLSELACLDLLFDFESVLIPEIVIDEVQVHRPGELLQHADHFVRIADAQITIPRALENIRTSFELHAGEISALAATLQFPGATFLTDDAAARMAANALGLRAHGTIGILLRSWRRQQRTKMQVLSLLRELPQRSTLHIAQHLLASIIAEVEQV